MNARFFVPAALLFVCFTAFPASAHFGMVLPSQQVVMDGTANAITVSGRRSAVWPCGYGRESGGSGRRARLRILCLRAWGFESPLSHNGASFGGRASWWKVCLWLICAEIEVCSEPRIPWNRKKSRRRLDSFSGCAIIDGVARV